jgi:hypothetical protein
MVNRPAGSNSKVGERPVTRSGHVVDGSGRTGTRNGNGNGNSSRNTNTRTPSRAPARASGNNRDTDRSGGQSRVAAASGRAGRPDWWNGVNSRKDEAKRISAGLHQLADTIWTPESNVSGGARSRAAKQGVTESRGAKPANDNGQASKAKAPATKRSR